MWARIENGTVAEITDIDPEGRFHPSLQWVQFDGRSNVEIGWHYNGEQIQPPPPESLTDLAARKRQEIDTARDAAFAAGLPYEIAGEADVIQTRPQDQINLLGLSTKARILIADGVTDPVMPFRSLSNITRSFTPQAMNELSLAALAYIEGVYQRSWERKDTIDKALDAADRKSIGEISW